MFFLIPGMQAVGLVTLMSSMAFFFAGAIFPNQTGFLGVTWQQWGFLWLIFAL